MCSKNDKVIVSSVMAEYGGFFLYILLEKCAKPGQFQLWNTIMVHDYGYVNVTKCINIKYWYSYIAAASICI